MNMMHVPEINEPTSYMRFTLSDNGNDSLGLSKYVKGAESYYKIFGEHNKPRGTYTGDGGTGQRVIQTGGIGNAVLIWRTDADMLALVTPRGTFVGKDTTVSKLTNSLCWPTAGGIVLNTNNEYVNKAGVTYTYVHL